MNLSRFGTLSDIGSYKPDIWRTVFW